MIDPSEFQALLTRKGAPDKYRSSVEGLANCASPTSDMIYNGEYYLLPGEQNVVSIIEYDLFFCNRNGYVSIMFILWMISNRNIFLLGRTRGEGVTKQKNVSISE